MEEKYYYLSVDKWNLMESLVTESISPYSFYWKRDFSNTLNRIKDEGNKKYSQLLLCTSKRGNDCLIGVNESLLDKESLMRILKRIRKDTIRNIFHTIRQYISKKASLNSFFEMKKISTKL